MDCEFLVEEVLKELQQRLGKENDSDRKELLIIGDIEERELEPWRGKLHWCCYREDMSYYSWDIILVTQLPLEMLGNLGNGCGGHKERLILSALMEGKQVYILEEGILYRKYRKSSFKALYQLYNEYEDKIKQYGMKFILSLADILQNEIPENEIIFVANEIDFTGKSLLLEADLLKKQVRSPSIIKISSDCIVTPLAEDYIKCHNLDMKRE